MATFAPPSLTSPLARSRTTSGAPTAQNLASTYKAPSSVLGPTSSATSQGRTAVENYQVALRNRQQQGQSYTNQFMQTVAAKKSAFEKKFALQRAGQQRSSGGGDQGGYSGPMPDLGNTSATDLRSRIVKTASSRLGTPYAWGGGGYGVFAGRGTGKGTQGVVGVDCSGLTSWVYSQYGIRLPRQSDAQLRTMGYKTSVQNARPGDLIGWNKGGHVAIYAGNGWLIESPKPGGKVQYRRVPAGTFAVRLSLPGD